MERSMSLHRKVSFRRSNPDSAFPDRDNSARRKKTLLGKLSTFVQEVVADEEEVKMRLSTMVVHESLVLAFEKLAQSYELVHSALITLRQEYSKSDELWNLYQRYYLMKGMIKKILRLNDEQSKIMLIPPQEPGELPLAYAQRLVPIINKNLEKKTSIEGSPTKIPDDLKNKFDGISIEQINQDNQGLHSDLYQLAKKYMTLRKLIDDLQDDYKSSKSYPFFPRYNLLKSMIADLMHSPAFIEICHENMNGTGV